MDFKLNFDIPPAPFTIQHGEGIVFLGSCFSDEIAARAKMRGFTTFSNPFGTVFHPSSLSQFIDDSIDTIEVERIFQRGDLFLSWDANSSIFDYTEVGLHEKLTQLRAEFTSKVKEAKVLFITVGTAWGYRYLVNNEVVANCHKVSNAQFEKELSSVKLLKNSWLNSIQKLKSVNPRLEIVFTVSPVRHIRDGLIENNQSKSILIELIRRLKLEAAVHYFPSYEIVLDELRDYRFFNTDRVHPSDEAIEYVWNRFESTFCDSETVELSKKVLSFNKSLSHRSLHEDSMEFKQFKLKIQSELTAFKEKYPNVLIA